MKRNVYLTVLAGITGICMLVGSLIHIGGWRRSAAQQIPVAEAPVDTQESGNAGATESGNTQISEGDNVEAQGTGITEIQADLRVGSLIITQGNVFDAQYKGDPQYEPSIEHQGSSLLISQNGSFSMPWDKSSSDELRIILPEDTKLVSLHIEIDVGECELNGLTIEEGSVTGNLGDIEFSHCILKKMDIHCDMGEVDIQSCDFADLTIEQSMGDVEIETTQDLSLAALELSTDLGEVSINDRKQGKTYQQSGRENTSLIVHNSMGDIDLEFG